MNIKPPAEERVWAVIAHLSAIAMGIGILLPVVGWSESRRKSKYASFHSLQALGYQTLGYTIWILVTLVFLVVSSIGAVAAVTNLENVEQEIMAIVAAHSTLTFGLIAAYFILPVIGAIACGLGREFRYPFMGSRLAKYLGYDSTGSDEETDWLIEEHEERWVASMGHFAVIVMLWGMLAPATTWIMHGKRSFFLKLQSVQAILFQAGTLVLLLLAGVLYIGGFIFFLVSLGGMEAMNLDSSLAMTGVAVFFGSLLCTFVIVLIVPLLHIMGQWAGFRVLKGDDYRYPLVGKFLEKRMGNQQVDLREEAVEELEADVGGEGSGR
jgi:uncharacterized Tic20 family protein